MSTYSPLPEARADHSPRCDAYQRAEAGHSVLFLLDEFLSLKHFPEFRDDAIRTHTSAGVRLWVLPPEPGDASKE